MGELCLAIAPGSAREAPGESEVAEKIPALSVIKRILPEADRDASARARFVDDTRVMLRLRHPNLVRVLDAGTISGEHYLAIEFVHGQDLRAVWNRCAELRRRIPIDLAVYVCCEVARGLAYAHEVMGLGLVHRDISPPNILIGYDGVVKVTDFGLAKSTLGREATGPGMLMGRHSYLSPEQARGIEVDHRADIYATGVVLWELLTGRQLLAASHRSPASALAAARNPNIRPPSELVAEIPEGLDGVVLEALSLDRDRRYRTAQRFRAKLSEILTRSFPGYDAEPAGVFMRDIFEREYRSGVEEHNGYLHGDFSRIRGQVRGETMSVSQDIDRPRKTMGQDDAKSGGGMGEAPEQVMTPRQIADQRRGTVIADRFRIEDLLSFDGMGALYRARDKERGGPCVLRVLPESYTRDPELTSRFMRDAKEVSELGHPNIVRVLDIGRLSDGGVYSGMEFLHGQSIATVIREEGKLSPSRAVHIGTQVCRALATAHEHSLIHRDLKPESVTLVAHEGDLDFVKVVDFGICKQVDSEGTASSPGTIIGTPDYMAPEQAAGAEANGASDIYALGCILFEMATGRPPYDAATPLGLLHQHRKAPIPPLPDTLSPGLRRLIERLLAKSPGERPQAAEAVIERLDQISGGDETMALVAVGEDDEARCTACGKRLLPQLSLCLACGQKMASLDRGDIKVIVIGPGEVSDKFDSALRDRLLTWIAGNPGLHLDPAPLAKKIPRLPFTLCTKVDPIGADAVVRGLETIGIEAVSHRGNTLRVGTMKTKAKTLSKRIAAIIAASGFYWGTKAFWLLPVVAFFAVGGTVWSSIKPTTKALPRQAKTTPKAITASLLRVEEVAPSLGARRHRMALRAVVHRALSLSEGRHGAAAPGELAQAIDAATVAAGRLDTLDRELEQIDIRAASDRIRESLHERDVWSARLLELTASLDAIQARATAALHQGEAGSADRQLRELQDRIEALEEIAQLEAE